MISQSCGWARSGCKNSWKKMRSQENSVSPQIYSTSSQTTTNIRWKYSSLTSSVTSHSHPTSAVPQPRRNDCPLVAVESLHNCETLDWKCCCGYWFDIYSPADKLTSCTCLTDHRASCWAGWRQKWLFRVKAGMCLWWCLFQRQRHFLLYWV